MSDELENAKRRGYASGYTAGRKRRCKDQADAQLRNERQQFLDAAFLAALPACITADGWKDAEGTPYTNLARRTELAWHFAREALRTRKLV